MYNELNLDIAQYVTLPSYSMDAFLLNNLRRNGNFKIEIPDDIDLVNLIQNNIRGGFCQLNTHSKISKDASKLLLKEYQENEKKYVYKRGHPVSCIETFDLNSNYASAMTEPLTYVILIE